MKDQRKMIIYLHILYIFNFIFHIQYVKLISNQIRSKKVKKKIIQCYITYSLSYDNKSLNIIYGSVY